MASTNTIPAWKSELGHALTAERMGDRATAQKHRTEARALKLAAYVEQVLAESPPLTQAQRERIAALLKGGGDLT